MPAGPAAPAETKSREFGILACEILRYPLSLSHGQELGWTIGGNVRIDYRWGEPVSTTPVTMAELAALLPDVVLSNGNAGYDDEALTCAYVVIAHEPAMSRLRLSGRIVRPCWR